MDFTHMLGLLAILLSVAACVVVYIFYKQTTERLNTLTQANLGISHTLHRLITASANAGASANGASGTVTGSGFGSNNDKTEIVDDESDRRITVSDDDLSSDDESDSDSGSGSGSESESDPDDMNESDYEVSNINGGGSIHIVSLNMDADRAHTKFSNRDVEMLEDENDDENDDDDSDDDSDSDSETGFGDEIPDDEDGDDSDIKKVNVSEFKVEKLDDLEELTDVNPNEWSGVAISLVGDTHTNIADMIATIKNTNNETNDDDIIPIKSSNTYATENTNIISNEYTDQLRHMKVEELRKIAVDKQIMNEDEAKKIKKLQLVQRLAQETA
jgi:hypothetical protein